MSDIFTVNINMEIIRKHSKSVHKLIAGHEGFKCFATHEHPTGDNYSAEPDL